MERARLAPSGCPIAASAELVGDLWSLLIMRECLDGYTRFDEFKTNLGIAPNILTQRLRNLVEGGLLERRQYSERPPRYEYVPTRSGQDFMEVLVAYYAWGVRHTENDQRQIALIDRDTGAQIEPQMHDGKTGRPLSDMNIEFVAGSDASNGLRARLSPTARKARRERRDTPCYSRS